MKTRVFQLVLFLEFALWLVSIPLSGQDKELADNHLRRSIISKIEVFIGVGHSYESSEFARDQVFNLRATGGIGISHPVGNRFDLEGKFMIEGKGNKVDRVSTYVDSQDNNTIVTERIIQGNRLDYLTFSIAPRYYLDRKKLFYISIGGFVGSLRKASTYTEAFSLQGSQISYYYADSRSNYADFDFGLSFNAGYYLALSKRLSINAQLLSQIGMRNIIDESIPALPVKTAIISLVIGITLKR